MIRTLSRVIRSPRQDLFVTSACMLLLASVGGGACTPADSTGGWGGSTGAGSGGATGTADAGAPGSGGSTSSPGSGGSTASGSGGQTAAGSGGRTAGTGGAAAGTGGATAGSGGQAAGSGGAAAGSGGATAGSGGRAGGTGGSAAGSGGSAAGSGGAAAGTGGAAAGTGGAAGPRPAEVWVATDGNDANPGTEAQPVATICDTVAKAGACYKICPSSYSCPATGATIWVKAGNYRITRKIDIGATRPGVAGGIMKLYAVAGARPVLDATDAEGGIALHIKGSYWHVRGLEIKNAPVNCVKIEGGNVTVENMVVHSCGNTGITISRYAGEDMSANPGSNNTVLNCDSYDNVGPNGEGEDADGFGAKEASGTNNVFRGCRAWNNADDGFDFYGWANPITVEDSWALESGQMGASGGDGNGFKLGTGNGNHVLRNTIAAYNTKRGYTSNGASGQSMCTNCRGCSNTEGLNDTGDRAVLGSVTNMSPCIDRTRAKGARGANGALPSI